jgi:hypothetical protein
MERDLRIGRTIAGLGRRDRLRLTEPSTCTTQGTIGGRAPIARRAPAAKPAERISEPKAMSRQFFACTRAEPMRSSQTCAAR